MSTATVIPSSHQRMLRPTAQVASTRYRSVIRTETSASTIEIGITLIGVCTTPTAPRRSRPRRGGRRRGRSADVRGSGIGAHGRSPGACERGAAPAAARAAPRAADGATGRRATRRRHSHGEGSVGSTRATRRRALLGKRLRLDRPPDDQAEVDDGDLQHEQQEDGFPDHVRRVYAMAFRIGRGRVRLEGTRESVEPMSTEALKPLLDAGEEAGCVNLSEFSQLIQELELDDEQLERALRRARGAPHHAHRRLRPPARRRLHLRQRRPGAHDDRLAAALPQRGRPLSAADRGRGGRAREAASSAATPRRRTG